jgi:septal ring factor EnvC (AmiA/AmiB activator)
MVPEAQGLGLGAGGYEQTLASLDQDERSLKGELDGLKTQESAIEQRVIARGRMMYRLVRVGLLPVGGGFNALLDHATRMERTRRALDQDVQEGRALSVRKLALLRKLDDVVTRRAPLLIEREAATKARALLGEAEDRKRSFDRAFQTSTGAGDYVAVYGGGASGPDTPLTMNPESFRSLRGRLPFPLAGRAEIRAVRRPGASGPGLEMSAAAGTPVRAVAPGRVAFADRYDSFGQLVILDHGDRYYTVMGDLAAIDVRVGDDVSTGAKIGVVGASTSGDDVPADNAKRREPALYFEVRHGATTVDPNPWFGL